LSDNFLTFRRVRREQESFNQIAFATDDPAGKSLVPLFCRNSRLFIQPLRRQLAAMRRFFGPEFDRADAETVRAAG
jgi:hypothetical protein